MIFKAIVEYEYPIEHKPPVKAEIVLHGDRVVTDNIKPFKQVTREETLNQSQDEVLSAIEDMKTEIRNLPITDTAVRLVLEVINNHTHGEEQLDEHIYER